MFTNNYSRKVFVVYDSWQDDDIKSAERNRLTLKNKSADIEFNPWFASWKYRREICVK